MENNVLILMYLAGSVTETVEIRVTREDSEPVLNQLRRREGIVKCLSGLEVQADAVQAFKVSS